MSSESRLVPLSPPRQFWCDLAELSRGTPEASSRRALDVSRLTASRQACARPPSWEALCLKAFATVGAAFPALRRLHLPGPRSRLYEHPCTVAVVAALRWWGDDCVPSLGRLREPEHRSVIEIDEQVRRCREAPLEWLRPCRRVLERSRWPALLRRLGWRFSLCTSGPRRVHYLGTFGVHLCDSAACTPAALPLLTTTLTWQLDGTTLHALLRYDSRVLDDATAARALEEMERVLHYDLAMELRSHEPRQAA
jgi:hypothetical protein